MTLMVFFFMFIIESATEKLCPLRASIDVLEGEYFFLCYLESVQEHFQEEAYTINWYKENAGKQQLIKETHRIVSQMNFLEFWPAELSDSGNYSVTHSNGKQNFTIQKWTLNVLERNKSSCFNKNHLTTEVKNTGTGHSLKCSDLSVNENDSISWYKDCKNYENETERELDFKTLTVEHSGIYTCKILISHEGKIYHSTNTIKLVVEEDAPEAVTLEIVGRDEEIETEIGKEEILNCTGFLGYYTQEDASLYWLINQKFPEKCSGIPENEHSICEEEFKKLQLGNKIYVTRLLQIKKVTDEDMRHNFTCMLQTNERTQIKIVKLKKGNTRDLPVHVFTTGMVLAVLFPCVAIAVVFVCVMFRVDLVLFYRNICRRDDTAEDGKEYDAFVSYLKDCVSPSEEEREFALKVLPMILEEKFGYKLCIFERDVSPGGESKMILTVNASEYQPKLIKNIMLTLCWILALFVSGAEVREINLPGCSHDEPQIWYRAISDEEFVLQCALPDRNAVHIYNNSLLKQHQVKWFWHQKDKESLKAIKESSNLVLQGDALWFKPVRDSASGEYICMIWGKIPCLKIVLEVQTKKAAKCSGYDTNTLYLLAGNGNSITCPGTKCYSDIEKPDVKWYKHGRQIKRRKSRQSLKLKPRAIYLNPTYEEDAGIYVCDYTLYDNTTKWTMRTAVTVEVIRKPLELECRVQFGFERASQMTVKWKRNNKENIHEKLNQETSVYPKGLKGHILLHVAKLKEVTERDLGSNFTCFAENSVGNATAVIQLKRKQRVYLLYVLCSTISSLFAFLLCTAFIYQHWIEIVLMYRSYLVHNETTGDGKEFDAFVSYAKLDSSEIDSTLISEERFALELLPDMLENKYGYKLCILERDILPGGAYTDEVVTAIKHSRRAIIILSPAYVSGPSIFELQAAVNCALEDKKIKLVLIKFQAFQEPETLPPVVRKALRILPVLTWKSSVSAAPNKKFWKYMRYHMPVKTTRILGNCSLKGFFQRLFSLVYR
ncbi:interleukin-18 receptor accessory protein isoform X2 [Opisthocomus hoazin]|uniref:interleukin-18 receptor accessory protein isoform X2 n=1 Tax=Opisthocomus hoazin TaxID=30419 RepID=UPI003F539799